MNRNALLVIIGVLVIAVGVLGYQYYQSQNTSKLELKMGDETISIEAK